MQNSIKDELMLVGNDETEFEADAASLTVPAYIADAHKFHGQLQAIRNFNQFTLGQCVKMCIEVEKEKLWRVLQDDSGQPYRSFKDFIDRNNLPFGHSNFYILKPAYSSLGEKAINLFGQSKTAVSTIKLLLDNKVTVTFDDTEETVTINGKTIGQKDTRSIRELVGAIKDTLDLRDYQDAITEKQHKKDLAEKDQTIKLLSDDLHHEKGRKSTRYTGDEHAQCRLELHLAFKNLKNVAETFSDTEKEQFSHSVFEDIGFLTNDLYSAYRTESKKAEVRECRLSPQLAGETEGDYIDRLFKESMPTSEVEMLEENARIDDSISERENINELIDIM